MSRLEFDSSGRFVGSGVKIKPKQEKPPFQKSKFSKNLKEKKFRCRICGRQISHYGNCFACNLKRKRESFQIDPAFRGKNPERKKLQKSSDFENPFVENKIDNSQDTEFWSLYKNGKRMLPLKFSNGKTQEDVVREVVNLIRNGKKIIFLRGVCGTGKSAIALNIARALGGKAAIVVPVKNLQSQYQKDYMGKMFLVKPGEGGERMKISMITGRDNHDSIFKPGVSCADPLLPDTIQINEKNFKKLKEYYQKNPLIKNKNLTSIDQLKRMSIAPTNPYWSPIINSKYQMNLPDANKKTYKGLNGQEFTFYHRKKGCSYYDQYQSYINSDVIIFNAAKYKIETSLDKKPLTEVDIIDEADEFLDSFSSQNELNLTHLKNTLTSFFSEDGNAMEIANKINSLIKLEEQNKRATGVDENKIFHINDTNLRKIVTLLLQDSALESETTAEDPWSDYLLRAIETAKDFKDFLKDTYLTYRYNEENLCANLVTTNLSSRLEEVISKNKAFVFMSGTLHSKSVLENVFGIRNYEIVEAETKLPGEIEIQRTGKEFDCRYENFNSGNMTREKYLEALGFSISKMKRPALVHVNAFSDLPNRNEAEEFSIKNILSKEELLERQRADKTGRLLHDFKNGKFKILYSTKCSRGVDFPGETCNSIVFTKYPNPNPKDTFWKILKKTHASYFWDFYKDKARREFLQRLYRALRSEKDHVFILSPDSRVLDAVQEIQKENLIKN